MPYDEVFDLSWMDGELPQQKCQYLAKPMFCMVGGEAHALCWHEHFHTKCPFKLKFHQQFPHKKIPHPADKL